MSMRMVVMMMGVLVALVATHAKGCGSTIVALFVKNLLVLDPLWLSSVLRVHSLETKMLVEICAKRNGFLRTLRHRASS